jgi:LCP family protein required for cell wall assembly
MTTILSYATDRFWRESDTATMCWLSDSATINGMATAVSDDDPRRTVLRVIVATLVVLALTTAAAVGIAYKKLDNNIPQGKEIEHKVKRIGGKELNILVMGSDSRDGVGNGIDNQTGIGRRSDVTILVHVSADRREVYGVSLPRDALVTRPDCTGEDGEVIPGGELEFFNEAFAVGGEVCTVAQVESLTGIYIDHYLSVDFNGFKDMVDAVDGVTVCIPEDVDDSEHNIHFDAGTQELHGQQALNYVRERSELSANADIGRMKRQQVFIASMINKVISADTLTKPYRVYNFIEAATKSIVPDPDLASLHKLSVLARQFRETELDDIQFVTVPFMVYEPDHNRLIWAPQADELWKRILADKPLDKKLSGIIKADDSVGTPSDSPSSGGGTPGGNVDATKAENGLCS